MKRIAVLASGRGSNFQAIIDGLQQGVIPAVCNCLITDNPGAHAIERARTAEIPVRILDFSAYPDRASYERALQETMTVCNPDLFILCGYMRLLPPETVRAFRGRILNIHPAILPSFPGLHAQRQALAYGVKVSGCTVHFVDEGMDSGPIVLQRCVPILPEDDEESLSERILVLEHQILVEAVRLFCEDRLRIQGRRVTVI